MKIGYISCDIIMGMQEQLLREGHTLNVYWCEKELDLKVDPIYQGMIKKYGIKHYKVYNGNLKGVLEDSDFIYCDYVKPRKLIHKIIRECEIHDKLLVGANADHLIKLEEDRHFGKQVGWELGLDRVESIKFTDPNDFLKYVKKVKHRIVIKAVDQHKSILSTYIPFHNKDAIYMAETDCFSFFGAGGVVVEPFHEGYEVCVGGYFNGKNFGGMSMINQEHKGALDRNMGDVQTGEVGTVSQWMPIVNLPKKLRNIMYNFEAYIRSLGCNDYYREYRGFIDMNFIISEGSIYLLEFTCRQGQPTEIEAASMVKGHYGDFLYWQTGYDPNVKFKWFDTSNLYVHGAMSAYGIPHGPLISEIKPVILGVENLKNPYHLMYAYYDTDGKTIRHDQNDRLIVVHGKGRTIQSARKSYVTDIMKLSTWYGFYRTDIGAYWKDIHKVI